MTVHTSIDLRGQIERLEPLAREHGLDFYPVDFEEVPTHFMMEVAVYGLPVRMPHWSFGVRYIYQLIQHRMGYSHLFEVVFPGNPGRAYLANTNSLAENTLVAAHVLGHADFSKNNHLFKSSQEQVGYRIVEQAAAHAHQIQVASDEHGQDRVEVILDAALALEQHIDFHKGIHRPLYPKYKEREIPRTDSDFMERYRQLDNTGEPVSLTDNLEPMPIPPHPEYDLLWFIANYAPSLEEWERDILLAVRSESFYFYPVFSTQIMNEGWACLWHSTLLREANWLPNNLYLDAIKVHSDVVRPYAGEQQLSLKLNPYHIGFVMWNDIVEREGYDYARELMQVEDDFSFIRNHLTEELAEKLELFQYVQSSSNKIKVMERKLDHLKELILTPKFQFGAPHIYVKAMHSDGTLILQQDFETDGRGIDLVRGNKVLEYINKIWRRPVKIFTVDEKGDEVVLSPAE